MNKKFPRRIFTSFLNDNVIDKKRFKELLLQRENFFDVNEELIDSILYTNYNPDHIESMIKLFKTKEYCQVNLELRCLFGNAFMEDESKASFRYLWETAILLEWLTELEELATSVYKDI